MVDRLFSLPRLAQLYDPLAPDRQDLAAYIVMLEDLGARSVLDIGCGTGTFALMLAQRGLSVIGLDPAKASLDVARGKPRIGVRPLGAGRGRHAATGIGRCRDDDRQRRAGLPR